MIEVGLKLYRHGYSRSKDIRLATDYQTTRHINPTKHRLQDIRLTIVILSKYVRRYSTIRLCRMIVLTSNVRRLADLRPDVHARPTVGTTDIRSFVDAITRVGARRDGKPLLSPEAVAHVEALANTPSDSGGGGATVGIYRPTPLRRPTLGSVRPTPDSADRTDRRLRQ